MIRRGSLPVLGNVPVAEVPEVMVPDVPELVPDDVELGLRFGFCDRLLEPDELLELCEPDVEDPLPFPLENGSAYWSSPAPPEPCPNAAAGTASAAALRAIATLRAR